MVFPTINVIHTPAAAHDQELMHICGNWSPGAGVDPISDDALFDSLAAIGSWGSRMDCHQRVVSWLPGPESGSSPMSRRATTLPGALPHAMRGQPQRHTPPSIEGAISTPQTCLPGWWKARSPRAENVAAVEAENARSVGVVMSANNRIVFLKPTVVRPAILFQKSRQVMARAL